MSELRIKAGDVTDTLVKATEQVGDLGATHAMVVLYSAPPGTNNYRLSVVASSNVTVETANWLCDKVKDRLLREEN